MKIDLEEFAKRKKKLKRKDARIEFRLDPDLHTWFKNYVEGLGLTITEALTFYMEQLRQSASKEEKTANSEVPKETNREQKNGGTVSNECVQKPHDETETSLKQKQNDGFWEKENKTANAIEEPSEIIKKEKKARTNLNAFKIGNIAPCPLCGEWTNYSKFVDHLRKYHGIEKTKEILKSDENLKIMFKMYLIKKEEIARGK
ncbi:hypothetical protein [Neobacillus vireti]|uniref:Uncharacterized protein n=1 Tax=Neobacillus vireti LMG 21834 TaxID=1131730 RepID=A0AB94ILA6_9BACI|nr:hypothetical protein [Neobacillus vireti]ETI67861.1 hypothetical protein BAVI_15271 [Neobacillus vireti LMG 21834]KLT17289.1 hypothetical protein AA980_15540 [Neobacillus vireti]